MNEQPLRPVKRSGSFSPVLMELTIIILFFALSTSIVVRLIASASVISNESRYHARAFLAMETVAEQIKADPVGDGAVNECGVRSFTVPVAPDLRVDAIVTGDPSPKNGTLYEIELNVTSGNGTVYTLDAARYVPDAEVSP
jgi:hypothetical protein